MYVHLCMCVYLQREREGEREPVNWHQVKPFDIGTDLTNRALKKNSQQRAYVHDLVIVHLWNYAKHIIKMPSAIYYKKDFLLQFHS